MARAMRAEETSFMISPLHAMLDQVSVEKDAKILNEHLNHPDVDPWVRGEIVGEIDSTQVLQSNSVIMMHGDHGSMIFYCVMAGVYDAHVQVLPEGRGKWAKLFFRACLHLLFTNTDAMEIIMRRPHGNLAALTMIRVVGGEYQFTNPTGAVVDHKNVPADIYSLTMQRWINNAPGLKERGAWLHSRLTEEASRSGGTNILPGDDPNLRHVGAATEFFLAGSIGKGVVFYNRWAASNGLPPAVIRCIEPLTLDIGLAMLIVRDQDVWIPICHGQQQQ